MGCLLTKGAGGRGARQACLGCWVAGPMKEVGLAGCARHLPLLSRCASGWLQANGTHAGVYGGEHEVGGELREGGRLRARNVVQKRDEDSEGAVRLRELCGSAQDGQEVSGGGRQRDDVWCSAVGVPGAAAAAGGGSSGGSRAVRTQDKRPHRRVHSL